MAKKNIERNWAAEGELISVTSQNKTMLEKMWRCSQLYSLKKKKKQLLMEAKIKRQ